MGADHQKRMRLISAKWGFILKDKFRNKKWNYNQCLPGRKEERGGRKRGRKEERKKKKTVGDEEQLSQSLSWFLLNLGIVTYLPHLFQWPHPSIRRKTPAPKHDTDSIIPECPSWNSHWHSWWPSHLEKEKKKENIFISVFILPLSPRSR